MKKFLLKIVPVIIVLILALAVRFLFYPKIGAYDRLKETKTNEHLKHSLIIIGDSKSQFGFCDSILCTHFSSVNNLSVWSYTPLDILEYVRKMDIKRNVVLINVSSRIYLNPDTTSGMASSNMLSDVVNYNLYNAYQDLKNKRGNGPWEYERSKFGTLNYVNKFRIPAYNVVEDSLKAIEDILSEKVEVITRKVEHLHALIRSIENDGNKVILIDLPERAPYNRWVSAAENTLHDRILLKTGLAVHDFGTMNDSLFYDSHHLNRAGTKQFSTEFLLQLGGQIDSLLMVCINEK